MKNILGKIFLSLIFLSSYALAIININTATKEELMSLNGIGEAKADAIIEYRKTNTFKSVEDLKNVSGIGDKIFENLKRDISISGKTKIPETKLKDKTKEAKDKINKKVDNVKEKTKNKEQNIQEKVKESKDITKEKSKQKTEAKNKMKDKKEIIKDIKNQ